MYKKPKSKLLVSSVEMVSSDDFSDPDSIVVGITNDNAILLFKIQKRQQSDVFDLYLNVVRPIKYSDAVEQNKQLWTAYFTEDPLGKVDIEFMNESYVGINLRTPAESATFLLKQEGDLHEFGLYPVDWKVKYDNKEWVFKHEGAYRIKNRALLNDLKHNYLPDDIIHKIEEFWKEYDFKTIHGSVMVPVIKQNRDAVLIDAITRITGNMQDTNYAKGGTISDDKFYISVDGHVTTLKDFIMANTEPGVDTPDDEHIERIRNLKIGEHFKTGHMASTEIKRVVKDDLLKSTVKEVPASTPFEEKKIIVGITNGDEILLMDIYNGSEPGRNYFSVTADTIIPYKYSEALKYSKDYWTEFFDSEPDQIEDMNERRGTNFKSSRAAAKYVLDIDGELHGFDQYPKGSEWEIKIGKSTWIFQHSGGGQNREAFNDLKYKYLPEEALERILKLWDKYHLEKVPEDIQIPVFEQKRDAILTDAIHRIRGKKEEGGTAIDLQSISYAKGGKVGKDKPKIINGNYLTLEQYPDKLVVKLNEEGRERHKEQPLTWQNFDEYFEDIQSNSDFLYLSDLGEAGLAMSSAEGITKGYYRDDGDLTNEDSDDSAIYWYPNYAISDPFEVLHKEGEVTFDRGDKYEDGGTLNDKQQRISNIMGKYDKGGVIEFEKKINLGKVDYYGRGRKVNAVDIKVEIRNKPGATDWDTIEKVNNVPELSMSGSIWDGRHYDNVSGGQNLDEILYFFPGNKKLKRLVDIWEEYHLNDMRAGTKRQTEAIKQAGSRHLNYDEAVQLLMSKGLYIDNGYKYGSAWLYQPIPKEIIAEVKQLVEDLSSGSKKAWGGPAIEGAGDVAQPIYQEGGDTNHKSNMTFEQWYALPEKQWHHKLKKINSIISAAHDNVDIRKAVADYGPDFTKDLFAYAEQYRSGHSMRYTILHDVMKAMRINQPFTHKQGGFLPVNQVGSAPVLPDDISQDMAYNKGGVVRVPNSESRAYVENRWDFKGNNLEGKTLDSGDYIVLSYGYYPLWYFNVKDNKWYGNKTKVSKTTSIHTSQSRPVGQEIEYMENDQLIGKLRDEAVKYEMGGITDLAPMAIRQLYPMTTDNTTIAHSGAANTEM